MENYTQMYCLKRVFWLYIFFRNFRIMVEHSRLLNVIVFFFSSCQRCNWENVQIYAVLRHLAITEMHRKLLLLLLFKWEGIKWLQQLLSLHYYFTSAPIFGYLRKSLLYVGKTAFKWWKAQFVTEVYTMAQNVEFILDVNRAVVWFKILTISCYKC